MAQGVSALPDEIACRLYRPILALDRHDVSIPCSLDGQWAGRRSIDWMKLSLDLQGPSPEELHQPLRIIGANLESASSLIDGVIAERFLLKPNTTR